MTKCAACSSMAASGNPFLKLEPDYVFVETLVAIRQGVLAPDEAYERLCKYHRGLAERMGTVVVDLVQRSVKTES